MLLKAKIYMCLALWNPDVTMHSSAEGLLSYWYNQQVYRVVYGENPEFVLSWDEFRRLFTLPNSDYLRIADCIQQPSEGV